MANHSQFCRFIILTIFIDDSAKSINKPSQGKKHVKKDN